MLFTFLVGLSVVLLLVAALTAIWERLHGDGELKKLERDETEQPDERSPSLVPEKPETALDESRDRKPRAKKSRTERKRRRAVPTDS